jgi:hypothetical protein
VLSTLCDLLLAHDFQDTFDALAPHFWARPAVPHADELAQPAPTGSLTQFEPEAAVCADLVAAVHETR